jgi:DNA invertase Pin-like site-specific DNA recombinase
MALALAMALAMAMAMAMALALALALAMALALALAMALAMAMALAKMVIKKAAIYVRVSTDKQELLNQLIALREYCKKSDFSIFAEFEDIISGKEDSRPGFDSLFNQAHKKAFDIVVFWDLSRFSRSGVSYTIQKLSELDNLGIQYQSFQEPYITSMGEFGKVFLSLLAAIAKLEREQISARTKAGLARLKAQGRTWKRGKDKKPRKWRKDKGIKRGVVKDRVIEYMKNR